MVRLLVFLALGALSINIHAGFGGMSSIEASETGPISGWTMLVAIGLMVGLGYLAVLYAQRFEGNLGYARIAMGIAGLLILISIFS